jgi:hypothetical protein
MNKLESALIAADQILNRHENQTRNFKKPVHPATVVPHIVEYRKDGALTEVPATNFHHALKIAKEALRGHIAIYKLEKRKGEGYDRRIVAAFDSSGSTSVTVLDGNREVTRIIPGTLQAVSLSE